MVDLNCDLGEGFPDDARIFPLISSANIACGFHAGNVDSMRRAVALAMSHGVTVGAHPSYRDRAGFGRRPVEILPDELAEQVLEQIEALRSAARLEGGEVRYLKPHGALYNRIAHDPEQADAVARAAATADLPLLGLAGSAIDAAARRHGVPFIAEAFADRGFLADGTLVPRTSPGAVLSDPEEVAERVVLMIETGTVQASTGEIVPVDARSLCVHGDSPDAVALLTAIRRRVPTVEAFA
ncbi:5-oxoprolinase subunit PxpA [Naasia lichenicola]|nr:5-oxoprolinase subunit PxpA [Naasia lichenicola]